MCPRAPKTSCGKFHDVHHYRPVCGAVSGSRWLLTPVISADGVNYLAVSNRGVTPIEAERSPGGA